MRRTLFLASMLVPAVAIAVFACLPDLQVVPPPSDSCGSGLVDLAKGEACDPGEAGAIGCTSTCQIDCDGGAIDPQTNHCYFWIDGVGAIDEAIAQCTFANAHLVSFVDLQELQLVVTKTKSLPGAPDAGGTWLALEKGTLNDAGVQTYYVPLVDVDLPGWSASCPGCFALADGGDADLPLGGANPQVCVNWRRSTSFPFTQVVCTTTGTTAPVLCEREPAGAFSGPCDDAGDDVCIVIPRTAAQKSYVLVTTPATFDNARAGCVTRGGSLVLFDSSSEREEVIREVGRTLAGGDIWIGLEWADDAGAWTWLDGTAASALPLWGDGEPSANAGAASIHIELGRYDTRLARAQADTTQVFQYLCQLAK